ncbi:YqgE/AlgH family protein [Prolixibacter sp. SD074]|jgi:putative transcriptional regulator|uniref:YqgE/AlgH family protein n=1 Tax=Prolixibacter sp. SD074 TaxID=2652391 RepID=UPI0012762F9C|nr:YqgE/AlgH family protein [Prolixibacter sp. SD074]GET30943.1 transcriptional regulator [Prolixibacter sp. SD074]
MQFDFFKIESKIAPKQGRIIISEPFLPGNYFNRSSVLLVEHSGEGAVGFILNKPVDFPVHKFMNELTSFNTQVFIGGPVSTNMIYFIHTLGDLVPGSVKVMDGLYWGGDFDHLKMLITSGVVNPEQVRFFLGYSGWSEGQLEAEIKENSWLVAETNVKSIMTSDQNFWMESVKQVGGRYTMWQNFPEDPNWN